LIALAMVIGYAGVARADFLYVSGFNSNNVMKFDGATGASSGVFIAAGSGGLTQAEQSAFAPDGSFLVNSFGSNQVLRYDGATGAFLNSVASIASPTGLIVHNGLAYVSSYSTSGFVNRYNATTGAFVDTFVSAGSGGLGSAHSLTFGPDGNLYVADNTGNRVMEYNGTTGSFLGVFASGNGLSLPTGLTFGPNGNLFVSSASNDRVLQFNGSSGSYLGDFIGAGSGGLSDPHGLIFRGDGNLYVAGGSGVRRYDATTGAFVDQFAASGLLVRPTYMTFSPQAVPEPTSLAMLGIGTAAMLGVARHRRPRVPQNAA